jgi:tetratricopeptide (TPR) repeat protein
MGDIQQTQGDLAGALLSYRASLSIREQLVQQNAANTEWQRGLGISHDRIGDIQYAQGDLMGAMRSYRENLDICQQLVQRALDIAECLQQEGKLNARQQGWVLDLRKRLAEIQ